jgi:hypothetical protein
MIRSIPTMYAGVRFRSRLEARWAAMFDQLGWGWTYEPFDLDGYIPDFQLQFLRPTIVEVKPELTTRGLHSHAGKVPSAWQEQLFVVGPLSGFIHEDKVVMGVLYEYETFDEELACLSSDAVFVRCEGHVGVCSDDHGFACRKCGRYTGSCDYKDPAIIRQMWNSASNPTQWNAPPDPPPEAPKSSGRRREPF